MTSLCARAGAQQDRVPATPRAGNASRILPHAGSAPRLLPAKDELRVASPARNRRAPTAGAATAVSAAGFVWIASAAIRRTTYTRQINARLRWAPEGARACPTGLRFPAGHGPFGRSSPSSIFSFSPAGHRGPASTGQPANATHSSPTSSPSFTARPAALSSNILWEAPARCGGATFSKPRTSERCGASWKSSASASRRWNRSCDGTAA